MEINEKDADTAMLQKHVDQLIEHFDSVQIFCTKASEDGSGRTVNANCGGGNCFASYGQIRHWIIECEQNFRNGAIRDDADEDDE
jgi:hypothetical protein